MHAGLSLLLHVFGWLVASCQVARPLRVGLVQRSAPTQRFMQDKQKVDLHLKVPNGGDQAGFARKDRHSAATPVAADGSGVGALLIELTYARWACGVGGQEEERKQRASIKMQAACRGHLLRLAVKRMLHQPIGLIYVLGGPGAGKSTVAAPVAHTLRRSVKHLSMGDILRDERTGNRAKGDIPFAPAGLTQQPI